MLGGLYVPTDGLAKAVARRRRPARAGRSRAARVLPRHEVLDIRRRPTAGSPAWSPTSGELAADVVVCCAGIWGPKVARHGRDRPAADPAGAPARLDRPGAGAGRPRRARRPGRSCGTRTQDLYYRERFDRLGDRLLRPPADAGRRRATSARLRRGPRSMPSVLPFTPDDFEEAWTQTAGAAARDRATPRSRSGINGLFSFTTDDFPLIGRVAARSPGFWVAEAVWVTHSAGVGRAMAEWLVDGHCPTLRPARVRRATGSSRTSSRPAYVLERDCQNFVEVYDIIHPLQPMEEPRPLRHQPVPPAAAGARRGASWRRPAGSARSGTTPTPACCDGPRHPHARTTGRRGTGRRSSAPRRRPPARRVAMYDMTALKRLEVSRPGRRRLPAAADHRQRRQVGRLGDLLPAARRRRRDPQRRHRGPARPPDRFQVGANGNLDLDWFDRHLPAGRHRAGPRHHPRHLLHRALGAARPRPASSR